MQAATGVDCHVEEPQKIYAKDWALNINLNEVETKLVFGGLAFLETDSEYLTVYWSVALVATLRAVRSQTLKRKGQKPWTLWHLCQPGIVRLLCGP